LNYPPPACIVGAYGSTRQQWDAWVLKLFHPVLSTGEILLTEILEPLVRPCQAIKRALKNESSREFIDHCSAFGA